MEENELIEPLRGGIDLFSTTTKTPSCDLSKSNAKSAPPKYMTWPRCVSPDTSGSAQTVRGTRGHRECVCERRSNTSRNSISSSQVAHIVLRC